MLLHEATNSFTDSAGQQRVPISFLQSYIIPVPSLEIQKKISPDDFRLEYIKMNPMWIYKKIADYDMKNTFMMVHVDR